MNLTLTSFISHQVVLDSDDKLFGGFGRIDPSAEYFTNVRTC